MIIQISPERPDSYDGTALITELQTYLASLYPPASQHGYSIERMAAEGLAFFIARLDGAAAGCGGVKIYPGYGEIKRVYVRPQFRGLGLSKQIMARLEGHAREQGVPLMRLETGIYQPEATGLYERMGYHSIPPFGEYEFDPLCLYYEKSLPARSEKTIGL
jgi:GNAT superfamily N-acetyltransferase